LEEMLDWLGLKIPQEEKWDSEIMALLEERQKARAEKNWTRSDQFRDQLTKKGVVVEDTPNGPRLKKI
jgi:cysteinyl-tRNA synthetase